MVKLINTKLQYVSHFHVSVTQQVNLLRILLIVIFPSMLVKNLPVMYQKIYVKTGQWAL